MSNCIECQVRLFRGDAEIGYTTSKGMLCGECKVTALESLKAELLEALEDAHSHLEYCGYGDKWESECATDAGLPQKIDNAIKKAKGQAECDDS